MVDHVCHVRTASALDDDPADRERNRAREQGLGPPLLEDDERVRPCVLSRRLLCAAFKFATNAGGWKYREAWGGT